MLTIHQLIAEFADTDCAVLHDKVYSLLSLAIDGHTISVDYRCLPQTLLYKLIKHNGWSQNQELQLLAGGLGILELLPDKFRDYWYEPLKDLQAFVPSLIDEILVATHQLKFRSASFSITKEDLDN